MLGRLFNSASSTAATSPSGTRPSTSHALESDELYTRNLLYPDSNSSVASSFHSSYSLSQSTSSSSASSFGDNIDLEAVRDVRVIIAQDAVASEHKVVVYDSKPCTVSPQGSVAPGDSDGPMSPTMGGPYGRSRRKNPQHASVLCGPDDELKGFTDCMFGVAPLSYRGPSTKVHILPSIEDRRPSTLTSPISSRRGSLRDDRSAGAQYYGLKALPQPQPAKEKRKSILITRLFSVTIPPCPPPAVFEGGRNIPQSNSGEHTSTPTSSVGSTSGFPFPKAGGQTSAGSSSTHRVPKQSKSTMYGVGLIISLPPTASALSSFTMHCCYHKPSDSDIPHRHEYCCTTPPSFEDEYHSPPQVGFNMECGLDAQSASSVNDGRMDLITKHWDVITRALSDLQRVAQERILENLTVARLQSPQPAPSSSGIRYLSSRAEMRKMGLMRDDILRSEVEHLRWRVVTGIRVPRVVVGQGRWDLWQEEAKWANQRFGGRDMNLSVDHPESVTHMEALVIRICMVVLTAVLQ